MALPPLDMARAEASDLAHAHLAAARPPIAMFRQRAVTRSLLCWCGCRSLLPIFRTFSNSISIRLLADDNGVIALDARIAIDLSAPRTETRRYPHFAIRPYPKEWERNVALPDGRVILVRPVRPEDEPLYERFFRNVSPHDMRLRFFGPVKDTGHAFIARLTQIDYGRAMALLAIDAGLRAN